MTNRAFFWAAVLAVILGGGLGGILIVVLDGSEAETPAVSTLAGPSAGGSAAERLEELASRIELGEADAEDLEEIMSRFPDGLSATIAAGGTPGEGAGGDAGRMIGTVESFEGGVLAVNSPIGPLETTVGDETVITAISESEGTLDDLTAGLRVTLEGERNRRGCAGGYQNHGRARGLGDSLQRRTGWRARFPAGIRRSGRGASRLVGAGVGCIIHASGRHGSAGGPGSGERDCGVPRRGRHRHHRH